MVYQTLEEIDFRLDELPSTPRPVRVLLTTPEHFDVQYVINPHMEGMAGTVDPAGAREQWNTLRETYESLSIPAELVQGQEDLLDMVFCANQTLPFYDPRDGTRGVVLSRMYAEQRRDEVAYYADFFRRQNYRVVRLPEDLDTNFEGMGDAIWHPGRFLLWGGYGFRTDREAYRFIAGELDVHVLALRLEDPAFYHLDTCFSVLDAQHVLIFPDAFDDAGRALIHHFFEHVIEAPEDEARERFACNAHCPDGSQVIIQRGCETTNRRLRDAGFNTIEVETDEFLKAGGSVFCMKQMIW